MSKYQMFKNAILAYEPDAADAPILESAVESGGKTFKALLGRKLSSKGMLLTVIILALAGGGGAVIGSLIAGGGPGGPGAPAAVAMAAVLVVVLFSTRQVLVTVGNESLDFYFIGSTFSDKQYVIIDKASLPYEKITAVKTRKGSFNTSFIFELSHNGNNYKVKATVPNKRKKIPEQEANMGRLLEVVEKYPVSGNR